jgi:hypothetical protein
LANPFPIRRTILIDTRAQPHYTRAQAQAVVQKRQPMEHVRIQKGEQSMGSAYVQLTAAVDEEIRKVKTAGQDLPWHEAADRVNKRQLGAYARALADAPVLKMTPAPEMPVMKMSTAAQALDMIATAKISEGLPHAQAYEEACREHPSLSLESRGGEPWKIA